MQKRLFRIWLEKIWSEHKIEMEHHNQQIDYSMEQWVSKNLWHLRKLYKENLPNA